MLCEQDRYLAGIVTGAASLTAPGYELCVREGLSGFLDSADPDFSDRVKAGQRHQVAYELAHKRVVARVLAALSDEGIEVLVFKGTALAYLLYPQPWLRSRSDTDLFIRESQRPEAMALLASMGMTPALGLPGSVAFAEATFIYKDEFGAAHSIDLHWRLSNLWLLESAASFEELWRNRLPLPALGEQAWTCDHSSALLIACVHRAAHLAYPAYELNGFQRMESDFTLWTYDMHLLSLCLSEDEWMRWADRVEQKKMAEFVIDGLERTSTLFGTVVPAGVIQKLQVAQDQISLSLLAHQALTEWQSFLSIPGSRKVRFLLEQLFPERRYMAARYGEGAILPTYLRRLWSGIRKRVS